MARISVIVAVYKMPEYLPRCIEGILGQSVSDLELILVDDGSPDHCGEICDGYAARDPRVKVIHKVNEGVCVARNTGLDWVYDHSDSDWIFFHDNDDWVHPETLERLLAAAEEQDAKIAVCGYAMTAGEDPEIKPEDLVPVCWKPKEFYLEHFVNATVCWGKLYHRSVFEGMRYPAGKYIEDEFLTYRLLLGLPRIAVIPAPLYAYFYNAAGISKKAWVPKRLDAWEAYDQQLAYFRELGDEDLVRFRLRNYLETAMQYLEAAESAPNVAEIQKEIAFMEKRIRKLIRENARMGLIDYWPDHEMLMRFYPLATRLWGLWKEFTHKK